MIPDLRQLDSMAFPAYAVCACERLQPVGIPTYLAGMRLDLLDQTGSLFWEVPGVGLGSWRARLTAFR